MPSVFSRTEITSFSICFVVLLCDVALTIAKSAPVNVIAYSGISLIVAGLLLTGVFYRVSRPDARLSSLCIAAAILVAFSNLGSLFNYLLLPLDRPRHDELLMHIDALMGYRWEGFVSGMLNFPALSKFLAMVYLTSLPQMLIVTLALGLRGDIRRLETFVLATVGSGLAAVLFWYAFPTSGPSSFVSISDETANKLGLVVTSGYGAHLNSLYMNGPSSISPDQILGLIAFPSYHFVMAGLALWGVWRIDWLRWPFVALNTAMMPAILLHGGHHFIDLFGGMALFAVSISTARQFSKRNQTGFAAKSA